MHRFVLVFLLFLAGTAKADNYYFSSQSGDDSRSVIQAMSPATPWQTLGKLNAFFSQLKPGDSVFFKRNEKFYGRIIISRSGSINHSIIFSAYGVGERPIITGLNPVRKWVKLGRAIWESDSSVSSLSKCNMVVIDGVNEAMGRYPNNGYLTYQSHNGNNSITSKSLSSNVDWTGAELVLRKNHYIIDRSRVVSQSGHTLKFIPGSSYGATDGFGFFIQNDTRTLDQPNEWYYNPSTKKLRIYSKRSPGEVEVAAVDTLIYMFQKHYITFEDIDFRGSNINTFYSYWSSHVVIRNCNFNYAGTNAISAYLSSYVDIVKTNFNNTNNNAITITSWNYTPVPTEHILIREDTIKNTAVLAGMGKMNDDQSERCAIFLVGSNNTIEKCVIDSTGYIPIWWAGNSSLIKDNFITNFCFQKDDGGAIWTWNNNVPFVVFTNQKVLNNIVLNGIGALQGSVSDVFTSASGIYCDCNSANIEISGNTVANCNRSGILIHDSHEISVKNNVLYNNRFQLTLFSDNYYTADQDSVSLIRNVEVKGNIFISLTPQQKGMAAVIYKNDLNLFGKVDSNYYAEAESSDLPIKIINSTPVHTEKFYSLNDWQSFSGYDIHSGKHPVMIKKANDLRFEYNFSPSKKTITLNGNYLDLKNKIYSQTITLLPFSSAVLLKTGP